MNKRYLTGVLAFAFLSFSPLAAEDISTSKNYKLSAQPVLPELSLPPVVAKVNGEDISINKYWSALIAASGNSVLTSMVDEILLNQEFTKLYGKSKAVKTRITVQTEERIAEIKKQFPSEEAFMARLKTSGMGLEELKKQINLQIIKEKFVEDKTKVDPKELKKYWDDNKDKMPKDSVWDDKTKKQLENFLRQTKFNEEYPKYIQALRQKSDIKILLN